MPENEKLARLNTAHSQVIFYKTNIQYDVVPKTYNFIFFHRYYSSTLQ